jgi:hypothetical protein
MTKDPRNRPFRACLRVILRGMKAAERWLELRDGKVEPASAASGVWTGSRLGALRLDGADLPASPAVASDDKMHVGQCELLTFQGKLDPVQEPNSDRATARYWCETKTRHRR